MTQAPTADTAKPSTAQLAPCASGLTAAQPASADTPASAVAADPALPKVSGAELCSTAPEARSVGAGASWARRVPLGGSGGDGHSGLAGAGGTAVGHPVVSTTTACHRLRCITAAHRAWPSQTCGSCLRARLNGLRRCCAQAPLGHGTPCSSGSTVRWGTRAACTPAPCASWQPGRPAPDPIHVQVGVWPTVSSTLPRLPSQCAARPCLSLRCSGTCSVPLLNTVARCCCRGLRGLLWCDAGKGFHEQWALLLPHDLRT